MKTHKDYIQTAANHEESKKQQSEALDTNVLRNEFECIKQNHYSSPIKGFPTYLIVDAESNKVIKKFGAELGDLTIDEIVKMLQDSAKK